MKFMSESDHGRIGRDRADALQDRKHAKRDIGACWLVLTLLFAAIFVLVCVPAEMLP